MITALIIGGASGLCVSAIYYISSRFSRAMDSIDQARERAGLQERIAALELELGIREATDGEIRAFDNTPPGAIIDDAYREWVTPRITAVKPAKPTHR